MQSLFDLNEYIRRVLALNFQQPVWIGAEIAQLSQSRGHYYLDLVQKGAGDEVLAQAQAVLWSNDYRRLLKAQGAGLESVLQEGLEVKLCVRVDFHERYGLKLQITDVDPAHTLGRLSLQRRETIEILRREGLLDLNRKLELPLVLQRIAVVTSEGAAGFQDFREHLAQNPYGYGFNCTLFNSAVQGKNTQSEVMAAVDLIGARRAEFDVAVIIRGGGARLDLAAFDGLDLCRHVARLPLPVMTGIGHDVDETVLDQVAHTSLKTPTAVADYLLQHNAGFESEVLRLGGQVRIMGAYALKMREMELARLTQELNWGAWEKLRRHSLQLDNAELVCRTLHPENVLRRGFSLTTKNGKVVTSPSDVLPGDVLETQVKDGKIRSVGI